MYTLDDSEDFHQPSLWTTLCDTSPPAASVVAAPIRNEWSPTSLGSCPALAATWRSAARASGYLHTLTSLPHRYDKGALSGIVGYTDSNSTMRATAPPPAPTPGRVPEEASSRANNDRPLLALIILMTAETSLNAGGLMRLQRGQPPFPPI